VTCPIPSCPFCKHLDYDNLNEHGFHHRCKAFQKIPMEILQGEHQHDTPYPGDNGITFERADADEMRRRTAKK